MTKIMGRPRNYEGGYKTNCKVVEGHAYQKQFSMMAMFQPQWRDVKQHRLRRKILIDNCPTTIIIESSRNCLSHNTS